MSTQQDPSEFTEVEKPFFEQLHKHGWHYLPGDLGVPYLTKRDSFADVILLERLKAALVKINPWLSEQQVNHVLREVKYLSGSKLMERNQVAMELLVKGVKVDVDAREHGITTKVAHLIQFDEDRINDNDFLVINQFRVDIPGTRSSCIPDLVLFVNGIPLVVVECKSPAASNPMEKAIADLLKYSNQRDGDEPEGVEQLFAYNLFMVATTFYEARSGTIGGRPKHYMEWKDTSPRPLSEIALQLATEKLSSQQMLIAGMLDPKRLLDILHNFVLFQDESGRTIKVLARYQQYRAVHEALHRLQTKQTRIQHGTDDQRGGIVWHTQGSGKSLTMIFLIRKMRTIPQLADFKVVVITDRRSLNRQLATTAELTGEPITEPKSMAQLPAVLRREGKDLVFTLIQRMKILGPTNDSDESDEEAEPAIEYVEPLNELNTSEKILILVDEAHRSHGNTMHANMMAALPNAAKIGFTGTPIMEESKIPTEKIFGGFIDIYSIKQSQDDGATRPIRYEGWSVEGDIADDKTIDEIFEETFQDLTPEQREAVKAKYVTKSKIRDAQQLINEHAHHIFRDYVTNVLPNGFKAQLVATSRQGAMRYQLALDRELSELLERIDNLSPQLVGITDEELAQLSDDDQYLVRAGRLRSVLERLEFAAVISSSKNDPGSWSKWTSQSAQDKHVSRFKMPLSHKDAEKQDGLAILCVKSMLLTGFDAPINQTLYIDRFLQGYELLQAIARVNRNYEAKRVGRVVDFFGVAWHLGEALRVYSVDDRKRIASGLVSVQDDLNTLDERHRKTLLVFRDGGIFDIADTEACVHLLRNEAIRAKFSIEFEAFLSVLNSLRFRSEARKYISDAKQLGFINKSAANLYRDSQLEIADCGKQVSELIDKYLISRGIDPEIEPIDVMDARFDKEVDKQSSDRSKAAAMEHAAKAHISKKMDDDPVLYQEFSERIKKVLVDFAENWKEQKEAFFRIIGEMRTAEGKSLAGLAPYTQVPFFRTLMKHAGKDSNSADESVIKRYAGMTVEILDYVRLSIRAPGFWQNPNKREVLRSWIEAYLLDNDALDDYSGAAAVADDLVDQAQSKHTALI